MGGGREEGGAGRAEAIRGQMAEEGGMKEIEQTAKGGIYAIYCAYTPKSDLYPQLTADIRSYIQSLTQGYNNNI